MILAKKDRKKIVSRLMEFFIIGLVMGITEDMLAIHFATNEPITVKTLYVATAVAVPFAIISEIVVDMKIFRKFIYKKNEHK